MAKQTFLFDTEAECRAFVAGVCYVNDSSIRGVPSVRPCKGRGFAVDLDDGDMKQSHATDKRTNRDVARDMARVE